MRYIISYFFITSFLFSFDYHLKPYQLSDNVNCFFGLPSEVTKKNGGNMINSCYLKTKEGYIVIDSGPAYSYARDTYNIMQKIYNIPVKYVINTSLDDEHVLGNDFFKEQGAIIVGPLAYKKKLDNFKKFVLFRQLSKEVMINTRIIPFDKYINQNTTLFLGGLEMNIKISKHDFNHLMIFFPSMKLIFVGDMIYNNRVVPLKDSRSLLVWEKNLERLKSFSWNDIISAHGYMTRRSALENTEMYLLLLKQKVLKALKDGLTRKEAIQKIKILRYSKDRLYKTWHPKNIATVYDELKNKKASSGYTIRVNNQKIKEVVTTKEKHTNKVLKINYVSFERAMKQAKLKHKLIFLKIRSTNCKYCDQLDEILKSNEYAKKIISKYFEIVEINEDYEETPVDVRISTTPTIIFLKPNDKKILMHFSGIQPLGELLEILNELVNDGHNGDYLRR